MQLSLIHPDVAEVLDILGDADPAPDWSDLYKIHEILLDNVPGFYQRGWVAEDQISTFTASVNRKEISGDLDRHARLKGDPPKRTMTLVEVRQLIGSVVTAWLVWLRSSSKPLTWNLTHMTEKSACRSQLPAQLG